MLITGAALVAASVGPASAHSAGVAPTAVVAVPDATPQTSRAGMPRASRAALPRSRNLDVGDRSTDSSPAQMTLAQQRERAGLRDGTGVCAGLYEWIRSVDGQKACTHGPDIYDQMRAHEDGTATGADGTVPANAAAAAPTPPGIPCYSGGVSVHVFYVYPTGGTSKLAKVLPRVKAAIAITDQIYNDAARSRGATRHVRWKMTASCQLVVTPVAADPSLGLPELGANLIARGLLGRTEKGMAIMQTPSWFCGGLGQVWADDRAASTNPNNKAGMLAQVHAATCWAFPYVLADEQIAELIAHELGHTMGAVQRTAPHATRAFHCWDESDIMCYDDGSGSLMRAVCPILLPQPLDCNHDDYFDPTPRARSYLATHWNVARNSFLSSSAPARWDAVPRLVATVASPAAGSIAGGDITAAVRVSVPPGSTTRRVGVYYGIDRQPFYSDLRGPPYQISISMTGWANGQTLTLQAVATDSAGRKSLSTPVRIVVGNPQVRLTSPSVDASVSGDVPWTADASAYPGRTVRKVDLLVNGNRVATDTTAPYGGTWDARAFADGEQPRIQAVVTDSGGSVVSSDQRTVIKSPPTVSLVSPGFQPGELTGGTAILAASASARFGATISRVDFLVDGAVVGSDTTAPYTMTWNLSGITPGVKAVTARALDSAGELATSQPVQVAVRPDAATVRLTAPAAGTVITGAAPVSMTADVTVPAGRTAYQVDFLVNGVLVASDNQAPTPGNAWHASWDHTDAATGVAVIHAVAHLYDDTTFAETIVASAGTPVTVAAPAISVAVSAPAAGAVIRGNVTLRASVSAAAGVVAGVSFYANGLELAYDQSAPYGVTWDTRVSYPDQPVELRAVAWFGAASERIVSAPIRVRTENLSVALVAPPAGATVHDVVTLVAITTTDGEATIMRVGFSVDGTLMGYSYLRPWSFSWATKGIANGHHVLSARADTVDGRRVMTPDRPITVRN